MARGSSLIVTNFQSKRTRKDGIAVTDAMKVEWQVESGKWRAGGVFHPIFRLLGLRSAKKCHFL